MNKWWTLLLGSIGMMTKGWKGWVVVAVAVLGLGAMYLLPDLKIVEKPQVAVEEVPVKKVESAKVKPVKPPEKPEKKKEEKAWYDPTGYWPW